MLMVQECVRDLLPVCSRERSRKTLVLAISAKNYAMTLVNCGWENLG